LGALDTNLSENNSGATSTSSSVYYTFYRKSSANVYYVSYVVPKSGQHYVCLKYIKDVSVSNFGDYFKFKLMSNVKGVTFGDTYGTLPMPTREDYQFSGWYTAADGGSQVNSSTTAGSSGYATIYAHWTPNSITNTVNLRVVSKDGSLTNVSNLGGKVKVEGYQISGSESIYGTLTTGQTDVSKDYAVQPGKQLKLTATANTGYVFAGFSTSSSAGSEIKNPTAKVTETASYYASVGTTYYVYFKQVSPNALQYDETDKYFYFEDGYYPQSDANFEIERMNFSKSFNKTGTAICSDGILTLNGSGATPSPTFTWKRDKFWAGQEYLIDIKLLSGSVSGYGRFVFETRKANNVVLSQRHNLDVRFQTGSYVFSFNQIDENEAKEFEFWIWEDSNLVFNNAVFKIEI